MYFNIKVLGGLEIEIYVESGEWFIVAVTGRRVKDFKNVQWLYNRIEANQRDYARIMQRVEEIELAA